MSCCKGSSGTHERSVGDSEDVAKLEIRHPNEGKDWSPGGDEVLLH